MTPYDKQRDDYFQTEKPSIIKSIGGLVTFSTILPLNIHTSIGQMARITWLWPLVSALVGLIGLAIGYALNILNFPYFITAAVIYGFFIWFNGFHHLDGLIDLGDALMVHGPPSKKIAAMRDSMIGTGGIGLFFIVAIISIASLNSILAIGPITAILICEMSGKIGLVSCCLTSKPGPDGTGRYFISSINIINFAIILVTTLIIGFLLANITGVLGVLGGVFGGALIAFIGKRNFKIATGDVLGASNEIGRLFSLIFMVIGLTLI